MFTDSFKAATNENAKINHLATEIPREKDWNFVKYLYKNITQVQWLFDFIYVKIISCDK